MTMSTIIIDSTTAVNSLVVFAFSGIVSAVALIIVLVRLFPDISSKLFPFLFQSTSAPSGGGNKNSRPGIPIRRPVNGVRMQLLLASAVLLVIDSINNLVMIGSAWGSRNANFVSYNIVRLLTFIPAGPIFTVALAQRIAVIIVMNQTWKLWFTRAVLVASVYICLQQQILMIIGLVEMMAKSPTPEDWINTFLIPQWTGGIVLILPIISIGGSLWSLRIAFGNKASSPVPSSGNSKGANTDGAEGGGGSSTGATSSPSPQPASGAKPSSSGAGPSPSVTSNGANSIKYPVSNSFKILTAIILACWVVFLVMITFRVTQIGVRPSAVSSLMISITVLAECQFETLLRHNKKKTINAISSLALKRAETAGGSKPSLPLQLGDASISHATTGSTTQV